MPATLRSAKVQLTSLPFARTLSFSTRRVSAQAARLTLGRLLRPTVLFKPAGNHPANATQKETAAREWRGRQRVRLEVRPIYPTRLKAR